MQIEGLLIRDSRKTNTVITSEYNYLQSNAPLQISKPVSSAIEGFPRSTVY